MLLIPLPKGESRGDQILNADSFAKSGYAIACRQEELDADSLCKNVDELIHKRETIRRTMQRSDIQNGTDNILKLIFSYCER